MSVVCRLIIREERGLDEFPRYEYHCTYLLGQLVGILGGKENWDSYVFFPSFYRKPPVKKGFCVSNMF